MPQACSIPVVNGLIPPPHSCARRVYANGRDSRSIQELMGMETDKSQLKEIVRYILKMCKRYGIDTNIRYSLQDQSVLMKVKEKTVERYPMFRKYENAWPITAYFRKGFKYRFRSCKSQTQNPGDGVSPHGQSVGCIESQALSHTRAVATSKRPESGASSGLTRVNRAMVVLTPRKTTSSSATVTHASPSTVPESSKPASGSSTRRRRSQRTSPTSRDRDVLTAASSARSSNTVLGWIVSFNIIPPADAQRIAELFASLGIGDMAYLRAFARMGSRNDWLKEMQVDGKLTEIQMRILRDMLEGVATQ